MALNILRNDSKCQNCGYTVDVAYCSRCGQQNTETRQSFYHLLKHFAEYLTHYDGAFWKTIKYLLFYPGKLTIEYLNGHRMRYVPPVKLYIFMSFVTFFLMAVMAPENNNDLVKNKTYGQSVTIGTDAIEFSKEQSKKTQIKNDSSVKYITAKQYDSINNKRPKDKKLSGIDYHFVKATMLYAERNPSQKEVIVLTAHTIPKILFIYMPVFAFWLWLLHGKKRWYFFDHGIFTLHYFSLLLFLVGLTFLLNWGFSYIPAIEVVNTITVLVIVIFSLYSIYYFFRSHSEFYKEQKAISRLKSMLLFFINFICIIFIMAAAYIYIAYNLH